MDVERRRAISSFYREEFLRHIDHLQAAGILDAAKRDAAEKALMARIDQLVSVQGFPALLETLLQSIDTLSRLSSVDPRLSH